MASTNFVVARDSLVKTALFGNDPNWGRILCAAGYSGVALDPTRVALELCGIPLLRDGEPLPELRGTLIVLGDSGFDDEQAMHWLLNPEESLGTAPIDALRAGRKAEVRRVAQALGL